MKYKRIVILVVTLMIGLGSQLFSQYSYFYGKNKVMKKSFQWKILESRNIQIHYYTRDINLVKRLLKVAQDNYERISGYLNIKKKKKIPVLFYSTHIDFEQTNLFTGFLPLEVEAMAEMLAHRILIHGDRPFKELARTLVHEMGHIFEYTILFKNLTTGALRMRRPPLWVFEGFSEYVTGGWESFDELTVRDMTLNDWLPRLNTAADLGGRYLDSRSAYDVGHLILDFIKDKYGDIGVRRMMQGLKGGSVFGFRRNFFETFGFNYKVFNYEFLKYCRARFKEFRQKENPEEYSFVIGPNFPFAYSFSHQLSPSGEMAAVLTVNFKQYKIDLILISMKDGRIIKNLTPGYTNKYDRILMRFNPTGGNRIAWHKAGDQIAFFARKEFLNTLVMVDILSGKIVRQIKLKGVHQPSSPVFHPSRDIIYFTGVEGSKSFIYQLDLKNGKFSKLSKGNIYIKAIDISPDGQRFVYSAKAKEYFKLYLGPTVNPEKAIQLTRGDYDDIIPTFSRDGEKIYYSSDELKSYNIYSIDLKKKLRNRYTDVQTGNFFPIEIPGQKDQIVMSSYFKKSFQLYRKDISKPLVQDKLEFEEVDAREEVLAQEYDIDANKKIYKPLSRLFINAVPSITIGASTSGQFLGYSHINFTDLMNDHVFTLFAASVYGYQSYFLSYLNQKNRIQFMGSLFYNSDSYYYDPYYLQTDPFAPRTDYQTVRVSYGGTLALHYPLDRSYRLELGISFYNQDENFDELFYQQSLPYAQFANGIGFPISFSLVGDTIKYAEFGPLMGHTFKFTYNHYLDLGDSFLSGYSIRGDIRKYFRITNKMLFAFRLNGFTSGGDNPAIYWTGGNNTLRSTYFRSLVGNNGFFFNGEFRFPLIDRAQTLIGTIGPIRGVFFFDIGGVWMNGTDFKFFQDDSYRLRHGISSYGFGVEFFLFGIPFHVEWVNQTDLYSRKYDGINFWIGYDF